MQKNRLEAFSDGVLAIIITIMVLELKVPHGADLHALEPLLPVLCSYVLSFVFIGIYWNNHHHLLHASKQVNGAVMWANLHLLFWLSLVPFTTAWMGENHYASLPTAVYGIVLLAAGIAYNVLALTLARHHGRDSVIASAVSNYRKELASTGFYAVAVGAAFWQPIISWACYVIVAGIWLVPDRRIEKAMKEAGHEV